jgi:apolipoprotein N-acyltransferase
MGDTLMNLTLLPWLPIVFAQVDPSGLTDMVERGGVIALLIFTLVAFLREWVFTGAAYKRVEQERDEWKGVALSALGVTNKAVTLVEKQ